MAGGRAAGGIFGRIIEDFFRGPDLALAGAGGADLRGMARNDLRGVAKNDPRWVGEDKSRGILRISDRKYQQMRKDFFNQHGRMPTREELGLGPVEGTRPYIRQGTRDRIQQKTDKQGRLIDPNTGKPITGTPDIGHKPGYEHRDFVEEAKKRGLTKEQIKEISQDPKAYRLEDPSANRSHKYEGTSGGPSKWFEGVRKNSDGSITTRNGLRITKDGKVYNVRDGQQIRKRDVPKAFDEHKPLTRQEQKALDLQDKADEARRKAKSSIFFGGSWEKEAEKLQAEADKASEEAKKTSWWDKKLW